MLLLGGQPFPLDGGLDICLAYLPFTHTYTRIYNLNMTVSPTDTGVDGWTDVLPEVEHGYQQCRLFLLTDGTCGWTPQWVDQLFAPAPTTPAYLHLPLRYLPPPASALPTLPHCHLPPLTHHTTTLPCLCFPARPRATCATATTHHHCTTATPRHHFDFPKTVHIPAGPYRCYRWLFGAGLPSTVWV